MQSLLIEVDGRALRFDAPRLLRIGRSIEADVVLASGSVSRQHAELRPVEDGWVLVDSGSQFGTYVGGHRITELRVTGTVEVQCGPPSPGSTLTITPERAADPPSDRPAGTAEQLGGYDETFVLAAPPPGLAGPQERTGPDLLVVAEGREFRFRHPAHLTIGRRPESDVVIADPVSSRMHGQVSATPGGWTYRNTSQEGTYLSGRRIEQHPFTESVRLRLGHPVAGPEVQLVPILSAAEEERRFARKRRNRRLLLAGSVVTAVVVLAAAAAVPYYLLRDDDDGTPVSDARNTAADTMTTLTDDELDLAKAATVKLSAQTTDVNGRPVSYSGSGSIITSDGLILTNAHVAKPSAPGLGTQESDPASFAIALTGADDDVPAAPEYLAETIVADGVLDLAIMQITATIDGDPIDPEDLDLPDPLPIGDSDELRTGDEITALGFPGVAHVATTEMFDRRALTVTRGVVSTFLQELPIDENRAWIDSDIRIGSGNSGGASINEDGEIVGINTQVVTEATVAGTGQGGSFTGGSARIRPVNFAAELIEIAEDGGDPDYVSPLLEDVGTDPMPSNASVGSAGWTGDGQGQCSGSSSVEEPQQYAVPDVGQTIYAEFAVSGVPDDTTVSFDFYDLTGQTVITNFDQVWDFGPGEICIFVPFEVPQGATGANAVFRVGEEVLAQNPVVFVEP